MSKTRIILTTVAAVSLIAQGAKVVGEESLIPAAHATDLASAVVAGDFQEQAGCAKNWAETCPNTQMERKGDHYTKRIDFPAGKSEFKIVLDGNWSNSYGIPSGGTDKNVELKLAAPTTLEVSFDPTTKHVGIRAPQGFAENSETVQNYRDTDREIVGKPYRNENAGKNFYFVLADRFNNGDPSNDRGLIDGEDNRLNHGFDPTSKGFYHGGDLKGLIDKIDYIAGLGTTALWLSPSFKNRAVQGEGDQATAGYHGYWITDFTQIDPHLGTNDEMKQLIAAAHNRGMKVYFDIVVNHTADIIQLAGGNGSAGKTYMNLADHPYKDAQGQPFTLSDYVGTGKAFPELNQDSFPFTLSRDDSITLVPDWLNDPTYYHNRGNVDFNSSGEDDIYGDFANLDDLFTEHPKVVDGMTEIYSAWVDAGLDGFRIDTAKHVNFEFWKEWTKRIKEHAAQTGRSDFFMFGEAYDREADKLARYMRESDMDAVLDFGFQNRVKDFASGASTESLAGLFRDDAHYITEHSDASVLPTFLGNHDMGRIGSFLSSTDNPLKRSELAHSTMFLTRGQPVVYYGDEQGFIGNGGDKEARQDMFATQVVDVKSEKLLDGSTFGDGDHFDENAGLYQHIKALAELRREHKALREGAQIERWKSSGPGVYAFSRIDTDEKVEYLVALNNSASAQTVSPKALSKDATLTKIYGNGPDTLNTGADGAVEIEVPGLSASVYKAQKQVSGSVTGGLTVKGHALEGLAPIGTDISGDSWSETSFAWRIQGDTDWNKLGTATGARAMVYHNVSALEPGTVVEYRTVTVDADGNKTASSGWGVVGQDLAVPGTEIEPFGPAVAGSFTAALCGSDWMPSCEKMKLIRVAGSDWSTLTVPVAQGDHKYKIAVGGDWKENYGKNSATTDESTPNGSDVKFSLTSEEDVTFFYNNVTHEFFNTVEHPAITLPGTFGGALECPRGSQGDLSGNEYGNWGPACLNSLMTRTGEHTYEFESKAIPAGNYEFKVAYNRTWDTSFGDGSGNYKLNFEGKADKYPRFIWNDESNTLSTELLDRGSLEQKDRSAIWLDERTIALPPALLEGRNALEVSVDLISVSDGQAVVKGGTGASTKDGAQAESINLESLGALSLELAQQNPYIRDYLSYRVPASVTTDKIKTMLGGGLGVAVYAKGQQAEALNVTGVQIPGVIDAVFAPALQEQLGVIFNGDTPTLKLWAPTAHQVSVELYPDSTGVGATESRDLDYDDATGIWSITGDPSWKNRAYKYKVRVWNPTDNEITDTLVTDPYSIGLTPNSQQSVIVDLNDPALKPDGWDALEVPSLANPADQMIYELHVRDFSIADNTVSPEHRGKYLAFTEKNSASVKHLKQLADAGLNTVHLLPTNDIASIPEVNQDQPAIEANPAPDSEQPQAAVAATAKTDGFNWGYDPYHYMTPEGSYASDPQAPSRIKEYRSMVQALAGMNLRVVSDQVYNHTYGAGTGEYSVLDKVVPGYYHRLNPNGSIANSTCCDNLATEHKFMEKLMIDSVLSWAKNYRIDGFRFDLMGHHSAENLKAVQRALQGLTKEKDGIDGSRIYLYGEGWNFGEVQDGQRFPQAIQGNLSGTNIGTFNDKLRNGVHGHEGTEQGFGTGLVTAPNGHPQKGEGHLEHLQDIIKVGMAGNLADFEFDSKDGRKFGRDLVLDGQQVGYGLTPGDTVNYVDAHDNQTLYDLSVLQLPLDTTMEDRVLMNTVQLATVTLGQSPAFWHAGTEFMRSKSLDRDSYNAGDHFNKLDLSGQTHNFGVGLPSEEKNGDKWNEYRPLLNNPALKASPADLELSNKLAQELLQLRSATKLMHLGDTELIKQKISFPKGPHGMITMHIDDRQGEDIDENLAGVVVAINAAPNAGTVRIGNLKGEEIVVSDILKANPRIKDVQWNPTEGDLTIPARTVVVMNHKAQGLADRHTPLWEKIEVVRGTATAIQGVRFEPYFIDPDASVRGYELQAGAPDWLTINDEGQLSAAPGANIEVGEVTAKVTVTYIDDTTDEVDITVNVLPNDSDQNQDLSYNDVSVTAGGPEGTTAISKTIPGTTYTLAAGHPEWVSIDGKTGIVTVNPAASVSPEQYPVTVDVQFADYTTTQIQFTVTVSPQPLVADLYQPSYAELSVARGTQAVQQEVTFDPVISDQAATIRGFALKDGAPQWLSVNDHGQLEAQPGADIPVGEVNATVVITYTDNSTDEAEVTVKVNQNQADASDLTYPEHSIKAGSGEVRVSPENYENDTDLSLPADHPEWISIADKGVLVVNPPADTAAERYETTVTARFADGSTKTVPVIVNVGSYLNQQITPTWEDVTVSRGIGSASAEVHIDPADRAEEITSYELVDAPEWVSITDSGTVQAAPGAQVDIAPVAIKVRVTYQDASVDEVSLTVTVTGNHADAAGDLNYPDSTLVNGQSIDIAPSSTENIEQVTVSDAVHSDITVQPDHSLRVTGTSEGTEQVNVTVRFVDGSTKVVDMRITVQPIAHAEKFQPRYENIEIIAGQSTTVAVLDSPEGAQFALKNAPSWVTINTETGELQLRPGAELGDDSIAVTVTVTYSDQSQEDINARVSLKESLAHASDPKWTINAAPRPGTSVVVPKVGDSALRIQEVTVPNDSTVSVELLDNGDMKITVADDENLAGQILKPLVRVTFEDGSTSEIPLEVLVAPKFKADIKDKTKWVAHADEAVSWSKADFAPAWYSINDRGELTVTPDAPVGTHDIVVLAQYGSTTVPVTATVKIEEPKQPTPPAEDGSSAGPTGWKIWVPIVALLGGILAALVSVTLDPHSPLRQLFGWR
ncbi:pullulanase-type alpha-1,6-glucosidase [Corynebacterium sp. ES2794-CONJ1]|uniref:pullulanase-type alpha-1,6-glucosidase n=1 Tax=Corynebacterium sp. ES2794-CONJ1 TaxID=2980553 RepID=UPI0021DAE4A3|nr:pullulanase-type alpha-1,6-glucosidase [Corynebacterium sp. ES2794-CONJ1]MCU9519518.1 pullulanase-type alpha-1,6-glucosidase [Corynebacterium sp. ES2794-CONJ1]